MTTYTLERLENEPEGDLIPSGTTINRGECDGLLGSLVDYHDAKTGEQFVQFHSDNQVGPSMCTIPALVVWFQFIEVA